MGFCLTRDPSVLGFVIEASLTGGVSFDLGSFCSEVFSWMPSPSENGRRLQSLWGTDERLGLKTKGGGFALDTFGTWWFRST